MVGECPGKKTFRRVGSHRTAIIDSLLTFVYGSRPPLVVADFSESYLYAIFFSFHGTVLVVDPGLTDMTMWWARQTDIRTECSAETYMP